MDGFGYLREDGVAGGRSKDARKDAGRGRERSKVTLHQSMSRVYYNQDSFQFESAVQKAALS